MVISDSVLGNTKIFIFTWTGFVIPAFLVSKMFRNSKLEIRNLTTKVMFLGEQELFPIFSFYMDKSGRLAFRFLGNV